MADSADRWHVTVERYARWGPFAWCIEAHQGLTMMRECRWAWTRAGAQRKAERWVRRLNAADDRRRRHSFEVTDPSPIGVAADAPFTDFDG